MRQSIHARLSLPRVAVGVQLDGYRSVPQAASPDGTELALTCVCNKYLFINISCWDLGLHMCMYNGSMAERIIKLVVLFISSIGLKIKKKCNTLSSFF